jgi:hypothetical protein
MNRKSGYEERSQKYLHVNAFYLDPEVIFYTNDVTLNSSVNNYVYITTVECIIREHYLYAIYTYSSVILSLSSHIILDVRLLEDHTFVRKHLCTSTATN